MSQRLSDVIAEYEKSRLYSQGMAPNTVRNEVHTLEGLMVLVGNIQVRHLGDSQVDAFLAECQVKGNQASTMNVHLQSLRNFFSFCLRRGYVRNDPMQHRRAFRAMPRKRLRVPAEKFPFLLDCAAHPRDRILVAIGLYLWCRESEAINLKIGDVDLPDSEVRVQIYKSKAVDMMPISTEFDLELRRWLTFYAQDLGRPLTPDMYLVPAKRRPMGKDPVTGYFVPGNEHLRPYSRLTKSADLVKAVLTTAGYEVRDEMDRATMEGMHTLRRSGARARFDYLVGVSYDGAIREVQAGLHHKSIQTTEKYLGLDLDTQRRSKNIKGKPLYGYAHEADNVITLGVKQDEQAHAAGSRV